MVSRSSPTTHSDVRIVLLGKTGVGKSAAGNSILGTNVFLSEQGPSSVTTSCQKYSSTVAARTLTVVDTPGFCATQPDLSSDIKRSVDLASPGVHAFLYVLPLPSFTEQEIEVVRRYKQCVGEEAFRYTVVLFTYGDKAENMHIETLIQQNALLAAFIQLCGGRYCVLNNKLPPGSSAARALVMRLLQVVDGLVRNNDGSCYTTEMLEEVQRRAEERLEQIREDTLREEEEEQRKHQQDIQRVVQETEDRVKREVNEKWEIEKQERQAMIVSLQTRIRDQEEDGEKGSPDVFLTPWKIAIYTGSVAAIGTVSGIAIGAMAGAGVGAGVGIIGGIVHYMRRKGKVQKRFNEMGVID